MEPTVPDQPWTTINTSCKTGRRTLKWWKECSAARFSLSLATAPSKCMRCAQELEVSYRSQCLGNPSYSLCQFLFYEPRWCGCVGRQCLRIDQASDQSKSSCPALHRPWNSRYSENQRELNNFLVIQLCAMKRARTCLQSYQRESDLRKKEIETGDDLVFMRRSFNKSPAQQREDTWSSYPLDSSTVYIFLCCGWGPNISLLRQKLGSILMW